MTTPQAGAVAGEAWRGPALRGPHVGSGSPLPPPSPGAPNPSEQAVSQLPAGQRPGWEAAHRTGDRQPLPFDTWSPAVFSTAQQPRRQPWGLQAGPWGGEDIPSSLGWMEPTGRVARSPATAAALRVAWLPQAGGRTAVGGHHVLPAHLQGPWAPSLTWHQVPKVAQLSCSAQRGTEALAGNSWARPQRTWGHFPHVCQSSVGK